MDLCLQIQNNPLLQIWKAKVELNGVRLMEMREKNYALVRFRMEFCPISVSPCSEGGGPTAM